MDLKDEQFSKAPLPIEVTEDGIVTCSNDEQLLNVPSLIDVIEDER